MIVAGCGIHNCGTDTSEHDGIHTFFIGKNAKVKYIEKHYGQGDGTGEKILNPGRQISDRGSVGMTFLWNTLCQNTDACEKSVNRTNRQVRGKKNETI